MEKEIWKDIPGYENIYQASTEGRIRSVDRKVADGKGNVRNCKGKILKHGIDTDGRYIVGLSKDGKKKFYRVHVLIPLSFIGNRPDGYHILHANGDKKDNRLENLSYDTPSQNRKDIYRYGNKNTQGKLSLEEVLEVRRLYATGNYTQEKLAEMFGIVANSIGKIITGKSFAWLNDDGTIDDSDSAVS